MNYGIGGTRIARQSKQSAEERWDKDFCSRVATMQDEADAVVVFGGKAAAGKVFWRAADRCEFPSRYGA